MIWSSLETLPLQSENFIRNYFSKTELTIIEVISRTLTVILEWLLEWLLLFLVEYFLLMHSNALIVGKTF